MAVLSQYRLENTGQEVQNAINDALESIPLLRRDKANKVDVLTKTNTSEYNPTENYHPATKLYVDTVRPTVTIGQTTTGTPGTQASVTNSGTNRDAILNFTIPKGETGAAAGFDAPTVSTNTLEPGSQATVSISSSGEDTNKKFNFQFGIPQGLQGAQGNQGYNVGSITRTSGTGAAGTTDVYTMKLNDANQTNIGTFSVYNGKDGTGSGTVTSVGLGSSDGSLNISNSPITSFGTINISHKNQIDELSLLKIYPFTIDGNGHIDQVGEGFNTQDIELQINKVTTITSESSNNQYPSALAVYNLFNSIIDADNISY